MLFMVIENFRNGDATPVYRRYAEKGRMLPEGLKYLDSWVDESLCRCFQLMECKDPSLLRKWTECWDDLVDFEIVPVVSSKEASERNAAFADTTHKRERP